MKLLSRRKMLIMSGSAAGIAALTMLPTKLSANEQNSVNNNKSTDFFSKSETHSDSKKAKNKRKKILVVGAHPDDPETGCGGTMILLSQAGHEIVSLYLTRGEAGINGKTYEEAARIRTNEALKACEIMGARAEFLSQIDGSCEITSNRYTEMFDFIRKENPDIVLTHWPIDGHRDHRICSVLVYDAWLKMNRSFELYYYEVESGQQTQLFAPTDFVNIDSVVEEKHRACYCHASQHMDEVFGLYHDQMEHFRGLQSRCKFAEAFVKHHQGTTAIPL